MAQRLFVEGINDSIIIGDFWKSCGLKDVKGHKGKDEFKIFSKPSGSKNQLKKELKLILKGEKGDSFEVENIGVVIDADQSPLSTWQSIKGILEKAGYTGLPAALPAEGLVITESLRPKLGVWIMPDNINPGYLEHFYQSLIRVDDNLIAPANAAIQALYDQELVRFSDLKKQKAFIYTWLAWQKTPGTSMGLAMKGKSNLFDLQQPNAQAFLAWSKQVFEFTEV